MYLTPEEAQKRKKRKQMMVNFLIIPAVAVLVGALVALLGAKI
ncbi:hypothetical protein [Alkalihalobacterium chitinilyticum]|uniref:Uncharacterized protein n=1 Tax=Alkalihalobacterium chitinilyticum TaxID=2980103 RepID=A0ABT5VEZ3_9BACI|nr:hypothetical protein [Alkalihalobacterium chitinilyticum]MDE5414035.1 hypothetical protein [Alkalihalobacterium chitinilyticum]